MSLPNLYIFVHYNQDGFYLLVEQMNDGQERPTDIIILDIMGKVIKHLDYFNSEMKITQIPAGTYFIEIVFANRTERYKVIKK